MWQSQNVIPVFLPDYQQPVVCFGSSRLGVSKTQHHLLAIPPSQELTRGTASLLPVH